MSHSYRQPTLQKWLHHVYPVLQPMKSTEKTGLDWTAIPLFHVFTFYAKQHKKPTRIAITTIQSIMKRAKVNYLLEWKEFTSRWRKRVTWRDETPHGGPLTSVLVFPASQSCEQQPEESSPEEPPAKPKLRRSKRIAALRRKKAREAPPTRRSARIAARNASSV